METADAYILSKIRWQIFGGLSFKTPNCPEDRRLARFFALIRATAKDFHVYFPNLPWCLRLERGPIGGALHNHFLLAGLPDEGLSPSTCATMLERWTGRFGGAPSEIVLFDPSKGGGDYVTKGLSSKPTTGRQGRDISQLDIRFSAAVWNPANHYRKSVNN
jgi:hypothetical protein